MKKVILCGLLATSLTMANSFGEIGLGYSKGDNTNNFITVHGELKVLGNMGARLEYTKDISENPAFSREDISRYGLFATYTLPILPSVSLTPKVGLIKTDGTFQLFDTLSTISKSSTTFTYGMELNYDFNDNISAFVGYTDYGNNFDIEEFDTSKLDSANYTFGIKIHL